MSHLIPVLFWISPVIIQFHSVPHIPVWFVVRSHGEFYPLCVPTCNIIQDKVPLYYPIVPFIIQLLHSQKKQITQLYIFIVVSFELSIYSWIAGLVCVIYSGVKCFF